MAESPLKATLALNETMPYSYNQYFTFMRQGDRGTEGCLILTQFIVRGVCVYRGSYVRKLLIETYKLRLAKFNGLTDKKFFLHLRDCKFRFHNRDDKGSPPYFVESLKNFQSNTAFRIKKRHLLVRYAAKIM